MSKTISTLTLCRYSWLCTSSHFSFSSTHKSHFPPSLLYYFINWSIIFIFSIIHFTHIFHRFKKKSKKWTRIVGYQTVFSHQTNVNLRSIFPLWMCPSKIFHTISFHLFWSKSANYITWHVDAVDLSLNPTRSWKLEFCWNPWWRIKVPKSKQGNFFLTTF